MHRKLLINIAFPLAISIMGLLLALAAWGGFETHAQAASGTATQGSLQAIDASGKLAGLCPLKHTDVKAEISGFLSRVTVTQEFENPFKEKIEAVYTFPLPQNAAVDDMTMLVGDRTVRGKIKRREEARRSTKPRAATARSRACSIRSGPTSSRSRSPTSCRARRSRSTISYVETLKYEDGSYEFVVPDGRRPALHSGQRRPASRAAAGRPTPTKCPTPRASRRHVAPPGTRAGHDISRRSLARRGCADRRARLDDARGRRRAARRSARARDA